MKQVRKRGGEGGEIAEAEGERVDGSAYRLCSLDSLCVYRVRGAARGRE